MSNGRRAAMTTNNVADKRPLSLSFGEVKQVQLYVDASDWIVFVFQCRHHRHHHHHHHNTVYEALN